MATSSTSLGTSRSTTRPTPAQYWLRRVLAALIVGVFLYGMWSLASLMFDQVGSSAADASPVSIDEPATHVVQPGDTLWSIAGGLNADDDIRVTVDELIDLNGSPLLEVGQRLILP